MLFQTTLALCVSSAALTAAQTAFAYTDPSTGVKFQSQLETQDITGGFQFGVALPQTLGTNDYIGNIIGSRPNGAGWSGINHGSGMLDNLMIIAWADGQDIKTSLRIAKYYRAPVLYANAASVKLTPLSKVVNATHFNLVYRCEGCFTWDFDGKHYNNTPTDSTGVVNFSFAQSKSPVKTPSYPSSPIPMHNNGYGILNFDPKAAVQADFSAWAAKAPAAPAAAAANSTAKPSRRMVKRFPQKDGASNATVAHLPKFTLTDPPRLGLEQPRIPIPTSSASTPILSLEHLKPTPVSSTMGV